MGFQVVVIFIDSFMDDVTYVSLYVECYLLHAGGIGYGSENFGLGSRHDDYAELVGANPQF